MIGGFRTGMEMNGHECVAFCEIDKYARQSYKAIYDTEGEKEWHDITQVSNDDFRSFRGRADVITGGFPCQAFSLAGKRRGFEDTRGTLFFDIARAIKEIEPTYALLENVGGLFSHDKGRTFGTIIQTLDELGYVVEWGLFNSKYWGVPQNRERVFILATRKEKFETPKLVELLHKQKNVDSMLSDLLEEDVEEKYYIDREKVEKLILKDVGDLSGVVPVLTPERVNKRQNGRRFKTDGEPMFTLTAQDRHGIAIREATKKGYKVAKEGDSVNLQYPGSETRRGRVGKSVANTLEANGINQGVVINPLKGKTRKSWRYEQNVITKNSMVRSLKSSLGGVPELIENCENGTNQLVIRKLTPLECWRLQGFTDEQFYKAKNDGVSDSQLYKQAGNSVTVNVIDAIAKMF